MKALLRVLGRMMAQVVVFLIFLLMLVPVVGLAKDSLSAASGFHWMAALLLDSAWLFGVLTLCLLVWYGMRPSAPGWLRDYILVRW